MSNGTINASDSTNSSSTTPPPAPERVRDGLWLVIGFLIVCTLFCMASWLGRGTPLFREVITERRQAPFLSLAKLVPQALGSFYAYKAAEHYTKGTSVRRSWLCLSAWLGCWCLGQMGLAYWVVVGGAATPPVPCLGDLFFFAGYGFVISALFTVVSTYRASGFAVGNFREHAAIAMAAVVVFATVGYLTLLPVALAPTPIGERLVNVGYPLLDFVSFIPTVVLLRITLRFRGGRVSHVWGVLLAGILFAMGGDMLFAIEEPTNVQSLGQLTHLAFIFGYTLCAYGMRRQYELVAKD